MKKTDSKTKDPLKKVTYTSFSEALKIEGILLRPTEAAKIIKVKRPTINGYWESGRLTQIAILEEGKEKPTCFCSQTEINRIQFEKEKQPNHKLRRIKKTEINCKSRKTNTAV